ncbi:GH1 family beta-glucosidase [Paenibacillus pinistramenti]|uniref:GH1 family beta-glucosidase n=1 Tax=Paenibacillus pinistramenti TaxID=1768003 RepID=UPI0011080AF6|nr:GH1 family beta-glucosidase [Paenibacillus pinistramenti]
MTTYKFPSGFSWGAATASYQIEGAANEGGRAPSIWDTFSKTPGRVKNGDTGDTACDSYHRYEEDIQLLKEMGASTYRFSIAWPRIYPQGRGEVNREGLDYYHRLVDGLLAAGIEPFCTLYHWDLPQALQDEGGWDNRATADAFVEFARTMFTEFGGKIKKWITFNEPWCSSFLSNYIGVHAPGFTDLQLAVNVAHHTLLAHGKTVELFRSLNLEGEIGIAPNITWSVPYSSRPEDKEVCLRRIMWTFDYFLDPIFFGHYPQNLLDVFAKNGAQPPVQPGDMELIQRPIDFIGGNYYSASIDRYNPDAGLLENEEMNMGYERTDIGWPLDPVGFYDSLKYIQNKYGDLPIYITENGACINNGPEEGRVHDDRRTHYLRQHLVSLHRAINDGVNIKGYMAWSLLDNFEWAEGYNMRFGLVYVNYETFERIPKDSYYWYSNIVKTGVLEV